MVVLWFAMGGRNPTRGVVLKHIRILLLFVMVISTLAPAIPAQAQTFSPTVTFTGGGYGHAIGMSQYGAYDLATKGKTSDQIIDTYYTNVARGTHMALDGTAPPLGSANPNIWVGLARDVDSITFSVPSAASGPVDLCQANDGQGACPRQDAKPAPGEVWELRTVAAETNECEFRRVSPAEKVFPSGDCKASVTWGAEYINVDGTDYRYGMLRIRQGDVQKETGQFHVSLEVPVEEYLLGLREVPLSWPTAALEAQVITGRTYALEKFDRFYDATQTNYDFIGNSRRSYCYCHVLDSTFDQNYRGMDNEKLNAGTYPAWAAAVGDTVSQVVTYDGSLIQAFYSSSTGGHTENSEDVFVAALPYSRSVADPWSLTPANPKASWEETVSVATIASVYGFSEISNVVLDRPAPNASMKITGTKNGSQTTETVSIAKKYSKLGLLSPSVSSLFYDPYGGESPYAFTDISGSVHWENINKIAELRITLGCNPPDNTKFCPLGTVTRGQMAAFLARALGLVDQAPNPFVDDDDSLFQADIEKIAAAGITVGCNPPANDRFCPDRPVTRAQMAAFLVRAYGFVDRSPDPFTDDDGSIFEADIERLAAAGVTLGCNPPANDRYCPDSSVLRQHMASFLVRAINYNAGG
jgi:SpoIID/LytB domain protein